MAEGTEYSNREQRFSFGYQTITWDLAGHPLDSTLGLLASEGYRWYEALLGDSLGSDFARRNLTIGPLSVPRVVTDVAMFERLAQFATSSEQHAVALSGLYVDGEWVNDNLWPYELAKVEVLARFLGNTEAQFIVCGGGLPEVAPRHGPDYEAFVGRLADVARRAEQFGLRVVYHPHLDTFVETREQLDRFMDAVDVDRVGLCLDPAHFQAMGDDPVEITKDFGSAIDYVHLKNWRPVGPSPRGYERYLGFSELAIGEVDVRTIVSHLLSIEFSGPVIVELDYSDDPDESCRRNSQFIRTELELALRVD